MEVQCASGSTPLPTTEVPEIYFGIFANKV
jgi:hypothetical protein